LVHHFINPDNSGPLSFCPFHCGFHFLRHAWCVRGGGAKNDLKIAIHELDCAHEMLETFLTSDPTDKKDIRLVWIDAVPFERNS
jgi:hypothetical protein